MAKDPRREAGRLEQFVDYYGKVPTRAELAVEREVFGANAGINSYTTVPQADLLAGALGLGPSMRVLDIGAGSGWPGLYLAEKTGCEMVLTDVPAAAIRRAKRSVNRQQRARCQFVVASGTRLPFQPRSFDAVLHTDVL
ncbi:MAG: class I SAM-dependent methyltransferase [Dehalococcoidia bacterium]|nr:class I SAM-dependent methyltransferase [Dehalococcoidia bacterium]MDZ4278484.1 class I SAM-dependent methyltransferase [Dehalococcoidia bacterium]